MPQHSLPAGRALIAWLLQLGTALGYHAAPEWEIADPEGAVFVDVAWTRKSDDGVPLFLFEVESRPTQGLAENASKVLTIPTANAPKPLFFFQVVLSGTGSRPARAARAYADHNYAIYPLEAADQRERFLREVFRQHARVADTLDPIALWRLLVSPVAPSHDLEDLFAFLFSILPGVAWTPALSALAISERDARSVLVRRLKDELASWPAIPEGDGYRSYWGTVWRRPLHLGLLAALCPETAGECVEALKRWQGDPARGMTMIGPYMGLDRDYDWFVIGFAPMLWTLLLVLIDRDDQWFADQLLLVLDTDRLHVAALTPTAVWALHVATARELPALYRAAAHVLSRQGGVSDSLLADPPIDAPGIDDAAGWSTFQDEMSSAVEAVTAERVRRLGLAAGQPHDTIELALRLLVMDSAGSGISRRILASLYRL